MSVNSFDGDPASGATLYRCSDPVRFPGVQGTGAHVYGACGSKTGASVTGRCAASTMRSVSWRSAELRAANESPLLVAHTNAAWSGLLEERGTLDDHERARAMATDALTAATAGGYGYIERDARDVLERLS